MERAYDDRISLYFCPKNRVLAFLLVLLGLGIFVMGFNRENMYMFLAVGTLFCIMGICSYIKERGVNVTGQEVDEYVYNFFTNFPMKYKIMNHLQINEKDIEEKESYVISGYTTLSIHDEPLLRLDIFDKKERSSNVQISYFMFDNEVLRVYTLIKSLIDSNYKERKWTWGLRSIKYCELSSETKMCMAVPGKKDGKAEGVFRILTIIDTDNLRYSFAFEEKHEETAKYISNHINKRLLSK